MHRIAYEFKEQAILKGGLALRLLNSPRTTNDLDYVFVPYKSKKDIAPTLEKILKEIPQAKIAKSIHSKALRFDIAINDINFQLEADVASSCKSISMSTSSLAGETNQLSQVIRIMSFDIALSHKLAAWNERRLFRDLYDVYYIFKIITELPDKETLLFRLNKLNSRLPKLKKKKSMTLSEFLTELKTTATNLTSQKVEAELSPLIDKNQLAGLDIKIRTALNELIEYMKTWET